MKITTSKKALLSLGKGIQDALSKTVWPEHCISGKPIETSFGLHHCCPCTHEGSEQIITSLEDIRINQQHPQWLVCYLVHQLSHEVANRTGIPFLSVLGDAGIFSTVGVTAYGNRLFSYAMLNGPLSEIMMPLTEMVSGFALPGFHQALVNK